MGKIDINKSVKQLRSFIKSLNKEELEKSLYSSLVYIGTSLGFLGKLGCQEEFREYCLKEIPEIHTIIKTIFNITYCGKEI